MTDELTNVLMRTLLAQAERAACPPVVVNEAQLIKHRVEEDPSSGALVLTSTNGCHSWSKALHLDTWQRLPPVEQVQRVVDVIAFNTKAITREQ